MGRQFHFFEYVYLCAVKQRCILMEEILNALYGIANNFLHGLKCLNQAKVESRMRWDKIDKMEYTKDLVRMALSSAVTLKESHDYDPEELRQQFGEVGRNLALYIYDLDIERQKQIINEEAEKCKAKPSCR